MHLDHPGIRRLLWQQGGVIARRQVLGLGGTDNDIERCIRRREWAPIHRGVYVDHTGPPSWLQRAWAAVLCFWPAALAGESSLLAHGVRLGLSTDRHRTPRIRVAVRPSRSLADIPGVQVRRVTGFDRWAMMHLAPPRTRVEHALLETASRCHEAGAVAVLGDSCQRRHTTAARLAEALVLLPRLPHRRLLLGILTDVAEGAYSVLERNYLIRVERPHGLPTGRRQRRVRLGSSVAFRDVEYVGLRTVVELDGRLGHEAAVDRWTDLERDLAGAAQGVLTLRAGWGQVLEPCRLAGVVGDLLRVRGWSGRPHPCSPGCGVAR